MALNCVLFLCTVSVLCVSNALPSMNVIRNLYIPRPNPYFEKPIRGTEILEEQQKESQLIHQSINKNYYISQEEKNWYVAQQQCKKMGMALASTVTEAEKTHLENYLQKNSLVPKNPFSGYWIGGHRSSDNNAWIWESNGQEIFDQFGWCPGEPSPFAGENCMEIKNDFHFIGWNNYYCENSKRFICESLPATRESDKNIVTDHKKAAPAELIKIFGNDETEKFSTTENYVSTSTEKIAETTMPAVHHLRMTNDGDILYFFDSMETKPYKVERYGYSVSTSEPELPEQSTSSSEIAHHELSSTLAEESPVENEDVGLIYNYDGGDSYPEYEYMNYETET